MTELLPYDRIHTAVANRDLTIWLWDFFGQRPAYYVRITSDNNGRVFQILNGGATIEYTQGIQGGLPLEFGNYSLKGVILRFTADTNVVVHATTAIIPDPCCPEHPQDPCRCV